MCSGLVPQGRSGSTKSCFECAERGWYFDVQSEECARCPAALRGDQPRDQSSTFRLRRKEAKPERPAPHGMKLAEPRSLAKLNVLMQLPRKPPPAGLPLDQGPRERSFINRDYLWIGAVRSREALTGGVAKRRQTRIRTVGLVRRAAELRVDRQAEKTARSWFRRVAEYLNNSTQLARRFGDSDQDVFPLRASTSPATSLSTGSSATSVHLARSATYPAHSSAPFVRRDITPRHQARQRATHALKATRPCEGSVSPENALLQSVNARTFSSVRLQLPCSLRGERGRRLPFTSRL